MQNLQDTFVFAFWLTAVWTLGAALTHSLECKGHSRKTRKRYR